jgi:serine protease Do
VYTRCIPDDGPIMKTYSPLPRSIIWSLLLLLSVCCVVKADEPGPSTQRGITAPEALVYITVSIEYPTGQIVTKLTGSGFLITEDGVVVTAKHVLDIEIPAGATRRIKGARASVYGQNFELLEFNPLPNNIDIITLRFSPALAIKWPYLHLSGVILHVGSEVTAWGFPFKQEPVGNPGAVSGLMGITPTLLPISATVIDGMSGGPVVDLSGAVVGVITGGGQVNGTPMPLNYMTPIRYALENLRQLGGKVRLGDNDRKISIPSEGAVHSFTWIYESPPDPGLRVWSRDEAGIWHERYPNGRDTKTFSVVGREVVNRCNGSVVRNNKEPDFEAFIPDFGCNPMWIQFHLNNGEWRWLAQMNDIH